MSFYLLQAWIQRGGGAFCPNSLKSPQNWPKTCWEQAPEPLRPLLFQILDPPLSFIMLITFTLMQIIRVIYGRHLACLGLDLDYIGLNILILAAICGNAVNR